MLAAAAHSRRPAAHLHGRGARRGRRADAVAPSCARHVGTPSVAEAAALLLRHAAARAQAALRTRDLRGGRMARVIHPIEVESYRILRARIDLSHLPPLSRAVAERVIHASADLSFGDSLVLDEAALERGREALLGGAPIYCDAAWPPPGSPRGSPIVPLDDPRAEPPRRASPARRRRCGSHVARRRPGAIWVIGNAPTALPSCSRTRRRSRR